MIQDPVAQDNRPVHEFCPSCSDVGDENDPLTKVIKTTSIFDSVQTGSMTIGEYSAGYYESCGGAWCEMGISFIEGYPWVRGATWIGIYTYFTSTEEDKAMSLIESIYF